MMVRRKLLGWAVALAALLVTASAADARGFRRYLTLRDEVSAMDARNQKLAEQNEALRREIASRRRDPEGPHRVARAGQKILKPPV
jgi:cell division protein FtsB